MVDKALINLMTLSANLGEDLAVCAGDLGDIVTKLAAAEGLAVASEATIPLLKAFLSNLQATERDEVGYCPACGEDYCRNHELQYQLINVIPGIEEILRQWEAANG